MKSLIPFLLMVVGSVNLIAGFSEPMIPVLNWELRSDWISVKTPKSWHGTIAKGDGLADDTAALQLSIASAKVRGGTVYLPPGRYRITETLLLGAMQMDSSTRPGAFSLIGHGRDTVIIWDGPADVPMLRLLGIAASRIVGITFDGRNRAASAIGMGGPGFQSHNLFRHCAFLNCRFAGIDSGRRRMNTSCTEQRIDNCLFENCGRGVSLADFNDYDCVIEGCEFRKCKYGVWTFKGNFYCRDTHFEYNTEADFSIESEHTSTIRRCTSYRSKRFLIQQSPQCGTVLQDCRIAEWSARDGAIRQNIVPALIFDTVFIGRVQSSPAIFFGHTKSETLASSNRFANSQYFKLITSNNTCNGIRLFNSDAKVKVYKIANNNQIPKSNITAKTSFLKTRSAHTVWTSEPGVACIPGKIFDVVRDFGAKAGNSDNSAAFSAAVAAAKAAGNGAMVYVPQGHYAIKKTIELSGKDYYFGGSGFGTVISWHGEKDGTLIHVDAPELLGIENLDLQRQGDRKDGIDILQTGNVGRSSLTVYDTVRANGFLRAEPLNRGIRFNGLGKEDRVLSRGTFGNMHFIDSQAAEILINNHYEGVIRVEGEKGERTGLTAIQFALLEICDPCVWIKNNNSLVMTDFYNEQSTSLFRFEGNGSAERGRISLGMIKLQARTPQFFDGYSGEITLCMTQFYDRKLDGRCVLTNTGDNDICLLLLGGYFYCGSLHWQESPGFQVRFLAIGGGPDKNMNPEDFIRKYADDNDAITIKQAAAFLDDMRRVGKLDLQLNYPNGR